MKVAVVGATGNIGSGLCRDLLSAGHQVRALSRGGTELDELVKRGAEPFIGSFDAGTPHLDAFFKDVDAAFTMVRSDWSRIDHYPKTAARLSDALRASPVPLVVNLSSFGAELKEDAGHSSDFHALESALNSLPATRIVHVRAGWFMENFLPQSDTAARYGRIATMVRTDIRLPCVAIADVRRALTHEFLHPGSQPYAVREVQGPEDLTMADAARLMSGVTGRRIDAVFISPDRDDVKQEFLRRYGTLEDWEYRCLSYKAFNDRRVRFHQPRTAFDAASTRFADFLRDRWLPAYTAAAAQGNSRPENFQAFLCRAATTPDPRDGG